MEFYKTFFNKPAMSEISIDNQSLTDKQLGSKEDATKSTRQAEKTSLILKIAKKLKWNQGYFLDKTPHCKHDFGCLENIISGSISSFIIAYKINTGINIITLGILKRKFKDLLFSLWSKDSLTWVCYLSLYTLVLKTVTCLLRRIRSKGDPYNDFLAGGKKTKLLSNYLSISPVLYTPVLYIIFPSFNSCCWCHCLSSSAKGTTTCLGGLSSR